MDYYLLICISVLTFSIISCGSSRKDAEHNTHSKSADTAQVARMQADTVPDMPPPPGPAPAPGTLRLRGKIIAIHAAGKDSHTVYEVQVLRTLGMGAGTPALVRNDTIKIASPKQYPEITKASVAICLIKHKREMTGNEDSTPSWQLLGWEVKNNQK